MRHIAALMAMLLLLGAGTSVQAQEVSNEQLAQILRRELNDPQSWPTALESNGSYTVFWPDHPVALENGLETLLANNVARIDGAKVVIPPDASDDAILSADPALTEYLRQQAVGEGAGGSGFGWAVPLGIVLGLVLLAGGAGLVIVRRRRATMSQSENHPTSQHEPEKGGGEDEEEDVDYETWRNLLMEELGRTSEAPAELSEPVPVEDLADQVAARILTALQPWERLEVPWQDLQEASGKIREEFSEEALAVRLSLETFAERLERAMGSAGDFGEVVATAVKEPLEHFARGLEERLKSLEAGLVPAEVAELVVAELRELAETEQPEPEPEPGLPVKSQRPGLVRKSDEELKGKAKKAESISPKTEPAQPSPAVEPD